MSDDAQACPKCNSPYGYQDGALWVCPECAHEWSLTEAVSEVVKDTVRVVKDLKVGGDTLKSGTKVKGIRLLDEPVNDHDISCRVEGFGSIYLKCSVVRKET